MSKEYIDEKQLDDLALGAVVIDVVGDAWQKCGDDWVCYPFYERTTEDLVGDYGPVHLVWGGE